MTILKADTIQQLQEHLAKFDKNLPVAVFDCDRGYMSVAFKKEEKIKNGKSFQWLTFYAHETIQMYDIKTLQGYLSRLPLQAPIAKKTENEEYTSLYLSIDSMRENGKFYQWLVLSDELEYDRFFRQHDTKTEENHTEPVLENCIEQALEKMLSEIKQESSQPIERIHQWLCKQTNQELFKGILTDGKTLKGAFTYCSDQARKMAKNSPSVMVEDDTVFQWISDYFIHYELPKAKPKKKAKAQPKVKKKIEPVNNITKLSNQVTPTSEKGGDEQQEENEQQLELFATI
ncbi:hypothetical protein JZO79_11855 [Vagococcus fluvialis]|uniref:Cas9 inhibitor AcrIIA9 family protein n=1 Tax=Vagococcus fluvialis TaxID=2738 RepID=UPI001A8CB516|nr:Cas9 inhibitor AcrIIA9 family protein [Vagococcus fluvialis]MBO0444308.1 hypothetical protein [Vagococcus fluvialis]